MMSFAVCIVWVALAVLLVLVMLPLPGKVLNRVETFVAQCVHCCVRSCNIVRDTAGAAANG